MTSEHVISIAVAAAEKAEMKPWAECLLHAEDAPQEAEVVLQ